MFQSFFNWSVYYCAWYINQPAYLEKGSLSLSQQETTMSDQAKALFSLLPDIRVTQYAQCTYIAALQL